MIEIIDTAYPKVIGLRLSGKLHDEDYKLLVRPMENLFADEGAVRLLIRFEDFHGWDLHAAWDDLWFSLKHYSDFERVAMVGDQTWERWMATFSKPFTRAKVKYFDKCEIDSAWKWLEDVEEDAEKAKEVLEQPVLVPGASNPWQSYT
jgi:hypothetical protein